MTAYAAPGGDPTAVMGRRIAAYLLDALIGLLVFAAIFLPVALSYATETDRGTDSAASDHCREVNPTRNTSTGDGTGSTTFEYSAGEPLCIPVGSTTYDFTGDDMSSAISLLYLIGFGSTFLNLVVLQGLVGGSVGKLMLGLRVVRENGNRAGIGWCTLRWILLFVDSFCCAIVGLVTAFSSKGHRRVGDMASGTLVVRKSSMGSPVQVPGYNAGYGTPGYGASPGYGGTPGYGSAPGSGQAGPAGWTPPPTGAPGSSWGAPTSPQTAAPTPSGDGPTWDQARNTYIQYDRDRSQWVQWDDTTKSWIPISQ